MNWVLFVLVAYLFCAMQKGLAALFEIGTIAPQFTIILGVFVGLFAPRRATLWAWGLLGFVMDMLMPVHTVAGGEAQMVLVGPWTFGMMAGGAVILQVRASLLKSHPMSHAFAVGACGIGVQLVAIAILVVRSFYDPLVTFSPLSLLWGGVLASVYTALFAIPLSWALIRIAPAFGFQGFKLGRN